MPALEILVRRPVLLVALLGLGAMVLRSRRRAARDDGDLWTRATSAPDLR